MKNLYFKGLSTRLIPGLTGIIKIMVLCSLLDSELLKSSEHIIYSRVFICYAVRWLPWRLLPLPAYDANRSWGTLRQENFCQCSLCAGNSGWQGRLSGPWSPATIWEGSLYSRRRNAFSIYNLWDKVNFSHYLLRRTGWHMAIG
jgi:hypothetical protein